MGYLSLEVRYQHQVGILWSILISSEFANVLLDIQRKLLTNKEKTHIFFAERVPKFFFFFF